MKYYPEESEEEIDLRPRYFEKPNAEVPCEYCGGPTFCSWYQDDICCNEYCSNPGGYKYKQNI